MLADFQQALADLTASPDLCIRVRQDPSVLHRRYELTERERNRLIGIVEHPGMECACIVYRANRLAPLALNIPLTCKALGKDLRAVVSDFWEAFPETNVHFYVEAARFCRFLQAHIDAGRAFATDIAPVLAREYAVVAAALEESYTERR
jgi:hypothetical protein